MKRTTQVCRLGSCSGFTFMEVLIASSISVLVATAALTSYILVFKIWRGIDQRMQADRDVNIAMSRMVYGMDGRLGIRAAAGMTITSNGAGWTVSYQTGGSPPQSNSFTYSPTAKNLVFNPGSKIVGKDISSALAIVGAQSLVVTLRVDRAAGILKVRREIGTEIGFRNL